MTRDAASNVAPLAAAAVDICVERDHYRATLVRIANAQSGVWGNIAAEALRSVPGREYPPPVRSTERHQSATSKDVRDV